jgi:hypothetical protein
MHVARMGYLSSLIKAGHAAMKEGERWVRIMVGNLLEFSA